MWLEFKKDRLSVAALCIILFLFVVAIFDDLIAGRKPIIMKYEGSLYSPAIFDHYALLGLDYSDIDNIREKSSFVVFPP
ncbi:MAG: hypothetical protein GWM89_09175, partial [Candidatus Dadabacteria bacterium]|nr:hypothetical protein [Candidatus Dadabacteria bacterium]NIX15853.1 hypothetical protein [Candidatus Dadabacteria bacterium]NIY22572.1 hypothetical protein [Candidatus Dadabacteria bacterium]